MEGLRGQAKAVLEAIRTYNAAHEGDSDDAEIDAAFEMEDAALDLVRKIAGDDPEILSLVSEIEVRRGG